MKPYKRDLPVEVFIRFTKTEGDRGYMQDRALLIARGKNGREYQLMYEDHFEELRDLTIYLRPREIKETKK